MAPIVGSPTTVPGAITRPVAIPTTTGLNGRSAAAQSSQTSEISATSHRVAGLALLGVRLFVGFEFLWAFFDKTFGLGYSTVAKHAWLNGGSPTTGFLSGSNVGPLQGVFRAIAGSAIVDWLFMLGLLGIGVALILGVALRPAAIAGSTLLLLMYFAAWPFASMAAGQPTGSTNPIADEHLVNTAAIIVVAALAVWAVGPLSRRWSELSIVKSHSWLR